MEKGEFVYVDVALLGEADRERSFADQTAIGEIFANPGDMANAEIAAEVIIDFSCRTGFADFLKIIEYRPKEFGSAIGEIVIDGCKRALDCLRGLLVVQYVCVDELEERGVQFDGLREHFAIRQLASAENFDSGQPICSMENPEGGVIEVAAGAKPLVGFVDGGQGTGGSVQELDSDVALANRMQLFTKFGDTGLVRIEKPPFRKEGMKETAAKRPFSSFAKISPGHEQGMDVDAVCIKRESFFRDFPVVDCDENEIDVGLVPDRVMRKAATEHGRKDRAVVLDTGDQGIQRLRELVVGGDRHSN